MASTIKAENGNGTFCGKIKKGVAVWKGIPYADYATT